MGAERVRVGTTTVAALTALLAIVLTSLVPQHSVLWLSVEALD